MEREPGQNTMVDWEHTLVVSYMKEQLHMRPRRGHNSALVHMMVGRCMKDWGRRMPPLEPVHNSVAPRTTVNCKPDSLRMVPENIHRSSTKRRMVLGSSEWRRPLVRALVYSFRLKLGAGILSSLGCYNRKKVKSCSCYWIRNRTVPCRLMNKEGSRTWGRLVRGY